MVCHIQIYLGGTDEQLGYMGTGIFDKYSADVVTAVLRDLRRAIISLPNSVKPKNVVVYGGGVNIKFARDVIRNACKGMNVLFMDGDATLLGCAKLGYTNVAGWCWV